MSKDCEHFAAPVQARWCRHRWARNRCYRRRFSPCRQCQQRAQLRDVIALRRLGTQVAAMLVGLIVRWSQRDGPIVVLFGTLEIADEAPHARTIVVVLRIIGIPRQRSIIGLQRARMIVCMRVQRRGGVADNRIGGRMLLGSLRRAQRVGLAAQCHQALRAADQIARFGRPRQQRSIDMAQRRGPLAAAHEAHGFVKLRGRCVHGLDLARRDAPLIDRPARRMSGRRPDPRHGVHSPRFAARTHSTTCRAHSAVGRANRCAGR